MLLSRHGAHSHRGRKSKRMKLSATWKEAEKMLQLYSSHSVSDFNSTSDYFYYLSFDVEEIKAIISFVSKRSSELDDETIASMRTIVPDLVKLTNVVSAR